MNVKKLMMLALLVSGIASGPVMANEQDDDAMPNMSELGIDFESDEFQKMIQQLESQVTRMKEGLSPEKRQMLEEMEKTTAELQEKMGTLSDGIERLANEKAEHKARVKELREQKGRLETDRAKLLKVVEELSDVASREGEDAVNEDEHTEKKAELAEVESQLKETSTELDQVRSVKRTVKVSLKEKEDEFGLFKASEVRAAKLKEEGGGDVEQTNPS